MSLSRGATTLSRPQSKPYRLHISASYCEGIAQYPNTTMSFGFGVGDFLAVGKLVWSVYSAYKEAPEQFRNFSQFILSLHIVIRKVEDQLGISSSDETGSGTRSQPPAVASLSTRDKNDLKILYDGLQTIMKELNDLLSKYRKLESGRNPIGRFRWGQEALVGFRDKIQSHITLLTAFNATLAKYVHDFIFTIASWHVYLLGLH